MRLKTLQTWLGQYLVVDDMKIPKKINKNLYFYFQLPNFPSILSCLQQGSHSNHYFDFGSKSSEG
jgi:hypothetical protein